MANRQPKSKTELRRFLLPPIIAPSFEPHFVCRSFISSHGKTIPAGVLLLRNLSANVTALARNIVSKIWEKVDVVKDDYLHSYWPSV